MRQYYVYILASISKVLYVGITNDLALRLAQHRAVHDCFTGHHKVNRLVHYETARNPMDAIRREKQIKGWARRKKVALIEAANSTWRDLSEDWSAKKDPDPSLRSG